MLSTLVPVSHGAAYLLSLSKTLKKLDLPSRTCNEESYDTFDVTQFTNLKSLTIGDISFNSVKVFVLENLPFLKTVSIGKNCFLNVQNADSKCFRIANCSHLKSFVVQEWSFQNCGGVIDISKLKRLKTIQIGSKDKESYNFMNASLHIHGLNSFFLLRDRSVKFGVDWTG